MPDQALLALIGPLLLGGFSGWQLWTAFADGQVAGRFSPVRRDQEPEVFWMLVVVHAAIAVGMPALVARNVYETLRPKTFAERAQDAYPPAAWRQGLGGRVLLKCTADAGFHPTGCAVAAETPAGYGFGAAALKIAAMMTLPERDHAKVQPGRPFNLPIRFTPPPPPARRGASRASS